MRNKPPPLILLCSFACLILFERTPAALAAEVNSWAVLPGEFGLAQGLHWGMSAAEAGHELTGFMLVPDMTAEQDPRFAAVATGNTPFSQCTLNFRLWFFRDMLDNAEITTASGQGCHEQIERSLFARFNDPNIPAACPNLVSRQWLLMDTAATYSFDCWNGRSAVRAVFHESSDASGRRAYTSQTKNCQMIMIDVLPASDGASDPVLAPDLPDFGCTDYPGISWRLQEQGAASVNLDVKADGSVADVTLATSSGKMRLDNAAVALAQKKLRFVPALRAGLPVEVQRQLRITFHLLHLIHGPADVLYRCAGGGSSFAIPCFGRFPGLEVAPARGGTKLTVVSSDIARDAPLAEYFSAAGQNQSPELRWSPGPPATQSYALIAEDPGYPAARPHDPFVFWMVLNIPASATSLPRGVPNDLKLVKPQGAVNTRGPYDSGMGYYGAGKHAVHFQIFALDTMLNLDPLMVDRALVISAIQGHVLASGEVVANEDAD